VLVVGASGGVGSHAVRVAKALGATVSAVASTTKLDFVRDLGADHVADYSSGALEELVTGPFDLILDIGGNRPVRRLRRLLTSRGALVIVGGEGGGRLLGGVQRQLGAALLSPLVRHRLAFFFAKVNSDDVGVLLDLVSAGRLRPPVERTFELADSAKALSHLQDGHVRGKVVVTP